MFQRNKSTITLGLLVVGLIGVGGLSAIGDEPPAKKALPTGEKPNPPAQADKPPSGPRVELAMMELAVLKEEMTAQKGKKLEGEALAQLIARVEAAERLLKPPYGLTPSDAPKKADGPQKP